MITLTDADNGQPMDVRADQVQAIRVLSMTMTQILLVGGAEVEVRETRHKVKALLISSLSMASTRWVDAAEVPGGPPYATFIATMGTHADKIMDVVRAAESYFEGRSPYLREGYTKHDTVIAALAALAAARKDIE